MTPLRAILALTMGEPAGIGGEVALGAWLRRDDPAEPVGPFVAIDDPRRLAAIAATLGWAVPIETVPCVAAAGAVFHRALPVLPASLPVAVTPGHPKVANAGAVIGAIERAVALALSGEAAGVVTNPIHKETLTTSGFGYSGHTDYLAVLAGQPRPPVMMLACTELRVVPLTVHRSLRAALDGVTTDAIVDCTRVTASSLRQDFGLERPRLAIAGLNPHAGEGGTIGREEIDIIVPAITILRREGLAVTGPHPPDSMFHPAARAEYDAAICMYHDQALIPLKTIDFERGVNVTLGLPFVRTSPDHGTAFDIAGTGRASPTSLIAALRMAADIAARRACHTAASG